MVRSEFRPKPSDFCERLSLGSHHRSCTILIDVHSENAEEDERQSQLKNSSVQKKLKALLMQLECVASLHLEVEERFRSLNSIVDICNDIELKEQT
ncbi:unnamed protein product [Anisakis simplex]|uniref:Ovule protein n=1 Tax=Anisakis simplex TaxID=6269 RepID=A0A0M3JKZ8_ANISI|nr:unnamed protein product [Anisakis simplex]